jgi:phage terminase large subunit-like protein
MTHAEQYARWVLDHVNEIKTGKYIKLAAKRFLSDLEREDIYFDEAKAVRGVNFIERYCYQWEGEWRGKLLQLEPWQKFIFEQLRGWIVKATGHRRFNKLYMQVSKKNGKSSMCAGLGLDHLYADDEINTPKVFVAANNEDQAKICVNMAGRMVEQSPDLYEYVEDGQVRLFKYKDNITEVVHVERDGFIKALSKESGDKKSKTAGSKHGLNPSLGLVDEFGMSPDYGASGAIESGMASRLQWLMAFFTTSGFNLTGPCYLELRDLGIQVLEGTITMDNYLPIIFEIDPPMVDGKQGEITAQWLMDHQEVWQQSNPNLGVSVNPSFLKAQLEKAILRRGTVEVEVKTLNFNIWCEAAEVWIPQEIWDKNTHGLHVEQLKGRICYGGIELSSGLKMSALSLYFPDLDAGKDAVMCMFWAPSELLRDPNNNIQFGGWADDGLIEVCPGNVVDNDFIFNKVMSMFSLYNVHSIAFNKAHENHDILQSLVRQGIQCNPIQTGYKGQNMPTNAWEENLTAGRMEHFGNPVLKWMNGQTMVNRNKEGEIRVQKTEGKTSGITASINALAQFKTITAGDMQDSVIESWG